MKKINKEMDMSETTLKTLQEKYDKMEHLCERAKEESQKFSDLYKSRKAELATLKLLLDKARFESVGVTTAAAEQQKNAGLTMADLLDMAGVSGDGKTEEKVDGNGEETHV